MIKSMTAFANAKADAEFGSISWEIRTVNHRYLDFSIRLPEEFRTLEAAIRDAVSAKIGRGKVDMTLKFKPSEAFQGQQIALNTELAESLLEIHQKLATESRLDQQPNLLNIMRWPGVIAEKPGDLEAIFSAALNLLDEALEKLIAMRQREGEAIASLITQRLDGIEQWVTQTREWLPEIRENQRNKLLDKIERLEQPLDEGRLEMEVSFLAQKLDVDEELDRLDSHVVEARRSLSLAEPVGRRLDFLMQEFNRESNTLGSKSSDARTSKASVELKVLIEQMREQIQNVE